MGAATTTKSAMGKPAKAGAISKEKPGESSKAASAVVGAKTPSGKATTKLGQPSKVGPAGKTPGKGKVGASKKEVTAKLAGADDLLGMFAALKKNKSEVAGSEKLGKHAEDGKAESEENRPVKMSAESVSGFKSESVTASSAQLESTTLEPEKDSAPADSSSLSAQQLADASDIPRTVVSDGVSAPQNVSSSLVLSPAPSNLLSPTLPHTPTKPATPQIESMVSTQLAAPEKHDGEEILQNWYGNVDPYLPPATMSTVLTTENSWLPSVESGNQSYLRSVSAIELETGQRTNFSILLAPLSHPAPESVEGHSQGPDSESDQSSVFAHLNDSDTDFGLSLLFSSEDELRNPEPLVATLPSSPIPPTTSKSIPATPRSDPNSFQNWVVRQTPRFLKGQIIPIDQKDPNSFENWFSRVREEPLSPVSVGRRVRRLKPFCHYPKSGREVEDEKVEAWQEDELQVPTIVISEARLRTWFSCVSIRTLGGPPTSRLRREVGAFLCFGCWVECGAFRVRLGRLDIKR